MFRPRIDAEDIGHLAEGIFDGLAQRKCVRHLGSPGSCRREGSDGKKADYLNRRKSNGRPQPLPKLEAAPQDQHQVKQRKQSHIALMDEADAEIQPAGGMKIPDLFLLIIQIHIQAPENPYRHPQRHGFHKAVHLADLVVGHSGQKKQNPRKKARQAPSGKPPPQAIQEKCQKSV